MIGVDTVLMAAVMFAAPTAAGEPFAISGEIDGLYPGASGTLPAEIANPYTFDITVQMTGIDVGDAGPGCPATMVTITDLGPPTAVPVGSTAVVAIGVAMVPSAPDACQGVEFPLRFHATAIATDEAATTVPTTTPTTPSTAPPVTPSSAPGVPVPPPTTVRPPPSTPGLAGTGSDVGPLLALAAGVAALGVVAIVATRRRR